MNKKVWILVAAISFAAVVNAQEQKALLIMKNGTVTHSVAVADIDSIVFVPAALVTDAGVTINGVKWATRNVAAPGTFAASQTDAGMFYQWNSKIGWSATDPLTSTNGSAWNNAWNGNGATTWEAANNPCPQGWRVPTQAELNTLVSLSTKTWTTIPAPGYIFTSGGNSLFLPAAGDRGSNVGTLGNVGTIGYYWSSTEESSNYAYYLYLGSGNAGLVKLNKSYGQSVRCVAE